MRGSRAGDAQDVAAGTATMVATAGAAGSGRATSPAPASTSAHGLGAPRFAVSAGARIPTGTPVPDRGTRSPPASPGFPASGEQHRGIQEIAARRGGRSDDAQGRSDPADGVDARRGAGGTGRCSRVRAGGAGAGGSVQHAVLQRGSSRRRCGRRQHAGAVRDAAGGTAAATRPRPRRSPPTVSCHGRTSRLRPFRGAPCSPRQARTATVGGAQNDADSGVRRIDVDGPGGMTNGSRATLSLPPGATVRAAYLYWAGVSNDQPLVPQGANAPSCRPWSARRRRTRR